MIQFDFPDIVFEYRNQKVVIVQRRSKITLFNDVRYDYSVRVNGDIAGVCVWFIINIKGSQAYKLCRKHNHGVLFSAMCFVFGTRTFTKTPEQILSEYIDGAKEVVDNILEEYNSRESYFNQVAKAITEKEL